MVIGAPKLNIWGVGAEEGPDFKKFEFDFFPSAIKLPTITCTGEAAMSIPATKPPKTRPSDPARDTLNPPLLLRLPLLSESKKEPDSEIISNRPSYVTVPPDIVGWRSVTLQMAPLAERIHTVRGPCCENAKIFDAMSSPALTVMTCGVNPTPPTPPSASSCFFPEPGGRPRWRLAEGSEADPAAPPPPPPESAREPGDWAVVANRNAMLPSGVYFLGRPRFFLAGSMLKLPPPVLNEGDPSNTPPCGKESSGCFGCNCDCDSDCDCDCDCEEERGLKENLAAAAAAALGGIMALVWYDVGPIMMFGC